MNEHPKSLLGSASVDPDKVETVSHADAMPQAAQDGGLGIQAREEALGNLLAVIHGDGGHRALEVGVEQAAAEAEKIVARLLSSAPEARERETWPERWSGPCTVGNMISNLRTLPPEMPLYSAYHIPRDDQPSLLKVKRPTLSRERVDGTNIKTGDESIPYSAVIWSQPRDPEEAHPAAPSADKLRIDLWWNAEDWEATFDNIEDAYEAATNAEMRGVAALGRATQHDTVFAARIDIDTTGDGDADDYEIRLFATREEALAATPDALKGDAKP